MEIDTIWKQLTLIMLSSKDEGEGAQNTTTNGSFDIEIQ